MVNYVTVSNVMVDYVMVNYVTVSNVMVDYVMVNYVMVNYVTVSNVKVDYEMVDYDIPRLRLTAFGEFETIQRSELPNSPI